MKDSIPRVLFLHTTNPGVAYYRMYCYAQKMQELKLAKCALFPEFIAKKLITPNWEENLFKDSLSILENLVDWADVVICQYISTPEGLSFVQAVRDLKPCYMEVDDYFPSIPSYSKAYITNQPGARQHVWGTRQLIESTGVITTTQFLADAYREFNENIHIIPNCIDFNLWDKQKKTEHELIRIGWMGGSTHEGDLRIIQDVIPVVLNKYPRAEFWITTSPPPEWPKHERIKMNEEWAYIDAYPRYVKERLSYDIGLAPLRDNYFNRAKSNLRYLEYSACKIPTIASNVLPFRENFIGYVVKTDEDWESYLSGLIESHNLRKEVGRAAYNDIKEKFNLESVAKEYGKLIERILNGSFNIRKHSHTGFEVRSGQSNIG